ncbi:hypothetical protein ACOME3_005471 [Neoechinorhynchus agilis]
MKTPTDDFISIKNDEQENHCMLHAGKFVSRKRRIIVNEINANLAFRIKEDKSDSNKLIVNYNVIEVGNPRSINRKRDFVESVFPAKTHELWLGAIIGAVIPHSDTVPAFLVNEGRTEIVPLSSIQPLKNEFCQIPRFASKGNHPGIKPVPNENKEEKLSIDVVYNFQLEANNRTLLGSFLKVNEMEGCFEVTLKDLEIQEYVGNNLLQANLVKATNEQLSCFIPPELQMDIRKEPSCGTIIQRNDFMRR